MNTTIYHAKYFAAELTARRSIGSIDRMASALMEAKVDLNPHQVDAALFAFRSPLSRGALLAEEVGLGKTIEGGIVMSQHWAEGKRSILVICPPNLRSQWQGELEDKFHLPCIILDKQSISSRQAPKIMICSMQYAAKRSEEIRQLRWDLVIIDEAHRLRNVYKGESDSKTANRIKDAVAHAPKILLTATPLQNSIVELYGLVSFIDDRAFGDLKSFKAQYTKMDEAKYQELRRRLAPICHRTLRRQVSEYIRYTARRAITQDFVPSADEHDLYEKVSAYLQRPVLYALPSGQRHLMTMVLRKLLASSSFAISGTLQSLAERIRNGLRSVEGPVVAELLSQDFEALPSAKEEADDEDENSVDKRIAENPAGAKDELVLLEGFLRLAERIHENSKGAALLQVLKHSITAPGETEHPKALIFTESRRTQAYLWDLLNQSGYQGKIVMFNGTNTDAVSQDIYRTWIERNKGNDRSSGSRSSDMRTALVEHFRDSATLMIATEAAAEGLNLQFCHIIINYDLPWNPQRIEQRIGRCHRYGQEKDVVVVNFLNKKNKADERVFELLDQKFKLFNGVFGVSDEVLGSLGSGVDFEKQIARIYQECRTTEEIQASFDQLQKDLEEQISSRMHETRAKLLENFDEEVQEKLRLRKSDCEKALHKWQEWLWSLLRFGLVGRAQFNDEKLWFDLHQNPWPDSDLSLGRYSLFAGEDGAHDVRMEHPLVANLIKDIKARKLEPAHVDFDLSSHTGIVSALEPLKGRSGWIRLARIELATKNDIQEEPVLCGLLDDGSVIDSEQCGRLFRLSGSVGAKVGVPPEAELSKQIQALADEVLKKAEDINGRAFDDEMAKLELWAEDMKKGIAFQIEALDQEIKIKKAEARKVTSLKDKVDLQRRIKEMEAERAKLRDGLFSHQDRVEKDKESLLDQVEEQLKLSREVQELMTIHWTVK